MNNVFGPIKEGHWVTEEQCPLCKEKFIPGNWLMFLTAQPVSYRAQHLQAVTVHASCGVKGLHTKEGTVKTFDDAAATNNEYPIILENGAHVPLKLIQQ